MSERLADKRRWAAAALLALVLGVLALSGVFSSKPAPRPLRVTATVTLRRVGAPLPSGFAGLSIEYPALARYLGTNARHVNPVFVSLIRALAPGGSPVLRIGGDSTDHTWWPIEGMLPPAGVNYALTPTWLATAHALAAETDARMILGINLAADSQALARAEAGVLREEIGRHYVQAFELGNEPDLYGSTPSYRALDGRPMSARGADWDLQRFVSQFSRWRRLVGSVPVAGPSYAEQSWLKQLPRFLRAEPGLGLVTLHDYPLRGCLKHPNEAPAPTIAHLLANAASAGLAAQVARYVKLARRDRLAVRIDETNSAACEGKRGVSNTFASALWVLDTLFNLQRAGVSGVNIHTLPGAPYEPFSFRRRGRQWSAQVRPIYYGMLAFVQAFPAGAHGLLVSAPDGQVKVWATIDSTSVRIVVIDESPSRAAIVRLRLPRSASGSLRSERLEAPSISAISGITLGGRSFGNATKTGRLAPARMGRIAPHGGRYVVTLPAASAVLLVENRPLA